MTYSERDLVARIEALAGADLDALTVSERDQFDQFHAGGADAVERILGSLRLAPGMTALDVGSGFGGPARQVATSSGCTVLGVDIACEYVEVAAALTRAAGLDGQVQFACTDVADLERDGFDAAYTMHVQMNVADKRTFYAGIARRLRPGGRLAVFEVCRTGDAEPALPLPWSLDGTDSHLVTPDRLLEEIEAGGLEVVEWLDDTEWIGAWFDDVGSRLAAGGAAVTLPAILDDGFTRLLNFAVALSSGALAVRRGAFVKAA